MNKKHRWQKYVSASALSLVVLSVILLNSSSSQIIPSEAINEQSVDIIEVIREESVSKQIDTKPPESSRTKAPPVEPSVISRTKETKYVAESKKDGIIVDQGGKEFPIYKYSTLALPNDPNANQWWVSDSNLESAWDTGAGGTPTLVAVLDTGFDLQHEELSDRWFTNSGESGVTASENASDLNCTDQSATLDKSCNNIDDDFNGILDDEAGTTTSENPSRLNCTDQTVALDKACNLIDDDGNGLIDDVRGWDFANFDQVVEAGETNPSGSGTTHGTKVSGIVGANANNSVGIAGVNWTTTILPIQVFNDDSYADTLTVSRAIRYAADMGADVISLSLGSWYNDSYMRSAISAAIESGSIVVASSGNDGCSGCILYPANYPEVLAVGSFSANGDISSFTSYGENLDLLAPGSSMISPTWNNSNDNSYAVVSGTSFSAPFVSGLLALAKSHQPAATWTELVAAMLENTDKTLLSGTHSNVYGFGMSDAGAFLDRTTTPRTNSFEVRFSPFNIVNPLSSKLAYQCVDPSIGSTALYQMTKNSGYRYTVNEQEKYLLGVDGWSNTFLGHVCVGLPTDSVSEIRELNLIKEFTNQSIKALD